MNNMLKYFDRLYSNGENEFYKVVENNLESGKRMFIITSNPETFTFGENDKEFNKMLLDKKSTLIPDGIGIVTAAKKLGYKVSERITGIDLANHLLKVCNEKKYKLALLGAKQDVLDCLIKKIKTNYPNIILDKYENGYSENKDIFFEEISKSNPDVCLVALGIPAQEKLIYNNLNKFKKGIFVGVGGSFDVMSGTKKRAPKIFQKLNIEWLYRIVKEPKRLKRFYNNNIKFILKIKKLKQKSK